MKKIAAAVLAFLLLLTGVAICMWTDLYLKEQDNLPKGVDVQSWDITGTLMITVGGIFMVLSILSIISEDDDDEKPTTPAPKSKGETIFKGR